MAELAQLLDFAERPRTQDWSLRAALTRYAQPEPQRVGDLLEQIRRVEPMLKALEKAGAAGASAPGVPVPGLVEAVAELDRLGDVLAAWAADPRASERPDAEVDAVTADVARRLDDLGVPREDRQRPPRGRG